MPISHLKIRIIFLVLDVYAIFMIDGHVSSMPQKYPKVSTVLVFGDSTSDPGNNNFIMTGFRGNFPPYGRDFPDKRPTGRFTNGLLATDLFARYLGVKDNVPPYLDPSLTIHDLVTGVSFASAASGFDPLTPMISNVISMPRQLEYFREYKTRLAGRYGKTRTMEIINNALYSVSAGTNDFVVNYFTLPTRRQQFSLPSYMDFILNKQMDFIQSLWNEGARKIAVVGLTPMGCLPIVITLFSDNALLNRGCIDFFSSVGRTYNSMLQTRLNLMQFEVANQHGGRITYLDCYSTLSDAVESHMHGFKEVQRGCCGTGLLEATVLCNPRSITCANASNYVFWDSIHPTEAVYRLFFESSRSVIDYMFAD